MQETFEGILVFDHDEKMHKAVELLTEKGITNDLFRYAINFEQKIVVLPHADYQGLSDIKEELFELACPNKSHLDGLVIDDEVHLISWDVHSESFFMLDGLEVAEMFESQDEKALFELSADTHDTLSEAEFIQRRNALANRAYRRLPGYIESKRVDEFFKEKDLQ